MLALCAPQAGGLPRKFRRSSHRCHRPQAPAPLTRTTRRSQYLQCLTQPRERLFPALPALSSPLALLPALLLQVHSVQLYTAARSPSALEGLLTRATHRHPFLLCSGRTARTPLRIAARALLALRSVRHMLPPPFYSSNVSRPRAPSRNKHLVVFVFFVFRDVLAAHAVH